MYRKTKNSESRVATYRAFCLSEENMFKSDNNKNI